jgi:hypothetical protein
MLRTAPGMSMPREPRASISASNEERFARAAARSASSCCLRAANSSLPINLSSTKSRSVRALMSRRSDFRFSSALYERLDLGCELRLGGLLEPRHLPDFERQHLEVGDDSWLQDFRGHLAHVAGPVVARPAAAVIHDGVAPALGRDVRSNWSIPISELRSLASMKLTSSDGGTPRVRRTNSSVGQ